MKKLVVLFIAASLALVSCSKDEIVDDLNHKEVKAKDLPGTTWTVKHIKIHEAYLDGKELNDAQKTTLEGLIKLSDEKLVLQEADKMYFKFNKQDFHANWTASTTSNVWDVKFTGTVPFGTDATLQIRNGRLYFNLGGWDYTIENNKYVIGKIEFEMVKHN